MVTLEVSRDGLTGGLQLSINEVDEQGSGHGYRIKGPKFSGTGEVLLRAELDQDDADQIRHYLAKIGWEVSDSPQPPESASLWPDSRATNRTPADTPTEPS